MEKHMNHYRLTTNLQEGGLGLQQLWWSCVTRWITLGQNEIHAEAEYHPNPRSQRTLHRGANHHTVVRQRLQPTRASGGAPFLLGNSCVGSIKQAKPSVLSAAWARFMLSTDFVSFGEGLWWNVLPSGVGLLPCAFVYEVPPVSRNHLAQEPTSGSAVEFSHHFFYQGSGFFMFVVDVGQLFRCAGHHFMCVTTGPPIRGDPISHSQVHIPLKPLLTPSPK